MKDSTQDKKKGNTPKPPRLSAKNKELWKGVTEAGVTKWLEENAEIDGKFEIEDGFINIRGDIRIHRDVEKFPFPFGVVTGNFDCSECNLKSLNNAPEKVGGDFECYYCCCLTSLNGAPKEVKGNFDCCGCAKLTSLQGAPKEVEVNFNCSHCDKLTSLQGAPQKVGGYFNCSYCSGLISLAGAPHEVGNFWCWDCGKKFTKKDVEKVCKVEEEIHCEYPYPD